MNTKDIFSKNLNDSITIKQTILENKEILNTITTISDILVDAFKSNQQLMFCGNGGSAADSQHLAAEFSGRYYLNRPPLKAIALHTDTSFLTAVSNDFSFDEVYSRLVDALGSKGDVLVGLSTSGNSVNVIKALTQAKKRGIITIGFTGKSQCQIDTLCDHLIKVPSLDTPRVQEAHLLIGHTICEIVEKRLFSN